MINWTEDRLLEQKIFYLTYKLEYIYKIKLFKNKVLLYGKRDWFSEHDYKWLEYYKEKYTKICTKLNRFNNIIRLRNIKLNLNTDKYAIISKNKLIKILDFSEYITINDISNYILEVDDNTKWKLLGYKR